MGDMRVITASERNVLHRADGSAMRFKIKIPLPGLGPTMTLTSKHEPLVELYKIIFGRQTKIISMIARQNDVKTFQLPDMNFQIFQEFWMTWYNKVIRMGYALEKKPFLTYPIETNQEIGYVQLNTASRNWAPVEWVIESSPVIFKTLKFQQFKEILRWVTLQNGKLPDGAMIGGFENEPIYIARALHNNSICPGKYVPSRGLAYVSWGHREHAKTEFEILCGYNALWVKTKSNYIPLNAFVGGHSEVQNEPLYIGRAMYNGKLLTGKVQASYKLCYLPCDGAEIEKSSYEILVIPQAEIPQSIPFKYLLES